MKWSLPSRDLTPERSEPVADVPKTRIPPFRLVPLDPLNKYMHELIYFRKTPSKRYTMPCPFTSLLSLLVQDGVPHEAGRVRWP